MAAPTNIEEFTRELDARGIKGAQRSRLLSAFSTEQQRDRMEARVQEILEQREQATESIRKRSPFLAGVAEKVVQPALAFAAKGVEGATFGHAAELAFPMGGERQQELEARIEAAGRTSPTAGFTGELAGTFLGPSGRILGGAGILGRGLAGAGLRGASRLAPLLPASTAASAGRRMASRVASQIVESAGAGGGAILANALLRDRMDSGGLAERFSEAGRQFISPTNVGLTLALGSAAGALRSTPDDNFARVLGRVSKLAPGFGRVTPAELRPGSPIQSFLGNVGKYSLVAGMTGRAVSRGLLEPLQEATSNLRARFFSGGDAAASTRAAAGVRMLVGQKEAKLAGTVERGRMKLREELFAQYGDTPVPKEAVLGLFANIKEIGRRISRAEGGVSVEEPRGADLGSALG
ncbi:MAG: hypothetical protein ACRD2L_13930, partial [Terriglobia bacterium]